MSIMQPGISRPLSDLDDDRMKGFDLFERESYEVNPMNPNIRLAMSSDEENDYSEWSDDLFEPESSEE